MSHHHGGTKGWVFVCPLPLWPTCTRVLTAPMTHTPFPCLVFPLQFKRRKDGSNADPPTRITYPMGVHRSCPLASAPISVSRMLRKQTIINTAINNHYYKYLWELLCSVLKPFLLPSIILLDCLPSQAMVGHLANMAKMEKQT